MLTWGGVCLSMQYESNEVSALTQALRQLSEAYSLLFGPVALPLMEEDFFLSSNHRLRGLKAVLIKRRRLTAEIPQFFPGKRRTDYILSGMLLN